MPIKFRCTKCKQFLGISREKAGAVVDCPTCGRTIRVPSLDGSVAPVPEPKLEVDDPRLSEALDELAALGSGLSKMQHEPEDAAPAELVSAASSAEVARAKVSPAEDASVEVSQETAVEQTVEGAEAPLAPHDKDVSQGDALSQDRRLEEAPAADQAVVADSSPVAGPAPAVDSDAAMAVSPAKDEPELIETPELVEDDEILEESELIEEQDDDLFDVDPIQAKKQQDAEKIARPRRSKQKQRSTPQSRDFFADDKPDDSIANSSSAHTERISSECIANDVIVDEVVDQNPKLLPLGELLDAETLDELSKIGGESSEASQLPANGKDVDLKDSQATIELAEEIPIAIPEPVDDLPEPVAVPVPKAESVETTAPATESAGLGITDAFAELANLDQRAPQVAPAELTESDEPSRGLPVGIIVCAVVLAFAAGFGGGWVTGKISSNSEATDVELEAEPDGDDNEGNGGKQVAQPVRPPDANDGEAVVRGRISLGVPGMAMVPDDTARVLILPKKRQGTLRIPAIALLAAGKSSDFEVARNAIRLMGGYLAIVDSEGRFESVVQGSGEFMLVAVSQTQPLSNQQFLEAAALRALEPFFDAPAEVLEQRMHHTFDVKLTAGTSQEWVCVLGEPGTHAKPNE